MTKYKTACAIVVNQKGEILLIKRGREPYKGYWALCSGIGESKKGITPETGIVEEVNCDLCTNSFVGKRLFSIPIKGDEYTDEVIVFVGKVNEKEIKMHPGFSDDYKWVARYDKQAFNNLAFEHSEIIRKYLKKKCNVRMKIIRKASVELINGVVILGDFDNLIEVIAKAKKQIKEIAGNNYQEIKPTKELLTSLADYNGLKRTEVFRLNDSVSKRPFTVVLMNGNDLTDNTEAVINLFSEKRPLNLVPIITLDSLSKLNRDLMDAILANFANFVVGEISSEDEKILKDSQIL